MAPLEVPSADTIGKESRPLLVSDDEHLVDEVLRLAAAAGASIELVPSAGAARPSWRSAPLVLLGADATAEAQRLHLPDRSGVVVVLPRDDSAVLKRAVDLGADRAVVLPVDEPWLVDRLADAVEAPDPPGSVVCVVGGRGGAGASTTAAALALTAMRMGMSPLLVDGDPLGGGVDLVVGGEDTEGLRWPDFSHTRGRVNGAALRAALPRVDQLTMLSWDRGDQLDIPVEAMRAVLGAAARCSDLVVVDLPRRVDEAAAEALARSTVTLLVVPAEVRAVAAASRVVQGLKRHAADIRVLVRGPAPTGLPPAMIATSLDLPVVASIRKETGLDTALDRGDPPVRQFRGPLARFCRDFLVSLVGDRRAA
ncbi:MAG: septum site-determining protein [Streptosporangiales bacterium]|nr:septum site-determining protein [Streptosporangiales bacterium]